MVLVRASSPSKYFVLFIKMPDSSRRDGLAREKTAQVKADTRAQRARDTADRRVADLEAEKESWRFKKSDRLRELLAKRVVMRDRDLGLVFLLNWNGERITQGYQFEQATKAAQEIGRKAASAGNAIAEIQSTLERKYQITPDEQAVLAAARFILADIHGRATHIKERARAAGTQKQKEDAARAQAAQAAVGKAFPALTPASIADAVRIALFLDLRHDYHFDELRAMRPATVERFEAVPRSACPRASGQIPISATWRGQQSRLRSADSQPAGA